MTSDIIITKKNESLLYLDCDIGILRELKDRYTFDVPGAKFSPKFKAKVWDGTISLINLNFGTLPVGLYQDLISHIEKIGYSYEVKESTVYGRPDDKDDITPEQLKEFVTSLNLHSGGNPIDVRDHQLQSVFNCIRNQKQISLSPTGSGKSLILYILCRWYLAKGLTFMLVVPNLSLIKQMFNDFKDYSSHNGFDIDKESQIVAEGADKNICKSIVLSTWQSIFKQPAKWFNDNIDVIAYDEVHGAKSECVKGIFEKSTNVKYRFGVTGSLDKSTTNQMVLRGLIGEISRVKTTRDLIEEGYLSEIKIACITLNYSKETRKLLEAADYHTEDAFLCQHQGRNDFIRKLALKQTGNTLVLFNKVENHGIPLYENIKTHCTTQKVHFISGDIKAEEREAIRIAVQSSTENNIIVASVGTMAVGINIPRLHNIIFTAPTKSVIRVMQSVGRGLRKSNDKDYLKVFDISDKIGTKSSPNYTWLHFIERLRIFAAEGHDYKIIEMDIEK
jgi:superfamily II DNA or RNA helicase